MLSTSHPHLSHISHIYSPSSLVEVYSLSLFQFSRLVKLSSPLCSPDLLCHYSNPQLHHAFHAITFSLSFRPRFLRVWILIAWLFCIRMSPRCHAFCVSRQCHCSLVGGWASDMSMIFQHRYASATSPPPSFLLSS